MISTKSTDLDKKYALTQGADRYLVKPFTGAMLMQTIGEVLPASLQAFAHQQSKPTIAEKKELESLRLQTLIPYRLHEADILSASNPFSSPVVLADKQVRRLYSAIDGYRNIGRLANVLQLDLPVLLMLLQSLWHQQFIALYDVEHHPLTEFPVLEAQR